MTSLPILRDLQATLDNLRTIDRDLKAFPPDLASLDQELKALDKKAAEIRAALEAARPKAESLRASVAQSVKDEATARAHLKAAHDKVQYAAAIRDIEDKERSKHAAEKPLRELDARLAAAEIELAGIDEKAAGIRAKFDELHAVFLAEHENQVAGRGALEAKRLALEAKLPALELSRFNKLIQQRQGRAVVSSEGGLCGGCRTKLRGLVINEIREAKTLVQCESCSRILFLP
ncbi:MAG TPA: C4-type zinc ribbon domain-containing protein [Holophagaceae bacterium]|nr:C4-type zinc ribbon domain-containing protein [Holophagaceae bacterium]